DRRRERAAALGRLLGRGRGGGWVAAERASASDERTGPGRGPWEYEGRCAGMVIRLCLALVVVGALSRAVALEGSRLEEMVELIEDELEEGEEREAFIEAV